MKIGNIIPSILVLVWIATPAVAAESCTCNGLAGNFPGVVLFCNNSEVASFAFSTWGQEGAGAACEKALTAQESGNPPPPQPAPSPNPNFTMDCTGSYVPTEGNNDVQIQIDVRSSMLTYQGNVVFRGTAQTVVVQMSYPVKKFEFAYDGLPLIETQTLEPSYTGQPVVATLEMMNGGGYNSLTPGERRFVTISEGVHANQGLPGVLMTEKYWLDCHIRY